MSSKFKIPCVNSPTGFMAVACFENKDGVPESQFLPIPAWNCLRFHVERFPGFVRWVRNDETDKEGMRPKDWDWSDIHTFYRRTYLPRHKDEHLGEQEVFAVIFGMYENRVREWGVDESEFPINSLSNPDILMYENKLLLWADDEQAFLRVCPKSFMVLKGCSRASCALYALIHDVWETDSGNNFDQSVDARKFRDRYFPVSREFSVQFPDERRPESTNDPVYESKCEPLNKQRLPDGLRLDFEVSENTTTKLYVDRSQLVDIRKKLKKREFSPRTVHMVMFIKDEISIPGQSLINVDPEHSLECAIRHGVFDMRLGRVIAYPDLTPKQHFALWGK